MDHDHGGVPMTVWRERAVKAREWFRGPRGLWVTGIVVVLPLMLCLMPQRVSRLMTIDGQDIGTAQAGGGEGTGEGKGIAGDSSSSLTFNVGFTTAYWYRGAFQNDSSISFGADYESKRSRTHAARGWPQLWWLLRTGPWTIRGSAEI